jgi:serine/threonine protein phosphatase PrpC
MGSMLAAACEPIVMKRFGGPLFRVGFAEMNGWRKSMEDAHVVLSRSNWGFFGVFDGHGGDQCSKYVAQRLYEELEKGKPADDNVVKKLMLRIDQEFLDKQQASGSTGTFAIVEPQSEAAANGTPERYLLRVGNIGDSRVLLGRLDGSIVAGAGTDDGITTDHKPDHPSEKERIERTGGHVEMVMGVARVNGDLAVSRAFGDRQHKLTGGPAQEDHPVTADPEFTTLTCTPTDFLILVCDGISEGNFPNGEVVKLAATELQASARLAKSGNADPAAAAAAVCRKALEMNSKDNLSCMIVLFGGGDAEGAEIDFISGPFAKPIDGSFRKAYEAMAMHAGLTLEQAVERRYDDARQARAALVRENGDERELDEFREEISLYGEGPPESLKKGTDERTRWFKEWLNGHEVEEEPNIADLQGKSREEVLHMVQTDPKLRALALQHGAVPQEEPEQPKRQVRLPAAAALRKAVEAVSALKWHDDLEAVGGQIGWVLVDDLADGTSKVRVNDESLRMTAWFPTGVLEDLSRQVVISPLSLVREAVEAHPGLTWDPQYEKCSGKRGKVIYDDEDGTSKVNVDGILTGWFPTSVLIDVGGATSEATAETGTPAAGSEAAQDSAAKRPRTDDGPQDL